MVQRLPLLAPAPPQTHPVAHPTLFAVVSCAVRFRGMTIVSRDRQRRVLPCLPWPVRQTAERESRRQDRLQESLEVPLVVGVWLNHSSFVKEDSCFAGRLGIDKNGGYHRSFRLELAYLEAVMLSEAKHL